MVPQSPRLSNAGPLARRRRPDRFVRLRCEQFEDRTTPALFNVTSLLTGGLNNPGFVGVTDLNKDGFQDAVLTNEGSDFAGGAGTTITLLYGRSGGGFNRVVVNTGGTNVSFASIADINGDSWPDVVATNENNSGTNPGSVSVFRNDGAGNLSLVGTPFSATGVHAAWVGLHDVTGDGVLDAVVCCFGNQTTDTNGDPAFVNAKVAVFQGLADAQGKGNFTFSASPIASLDPELKFSPTSAAVADFDGDGFLDIAATSAEVPQAVGDPLPNGIVYLFKGNGTGGFAATSQYDTGGSLAVNIQAADLNGDGKKDLVIANAGEAASTSDPNNPTFLFTNNAVGYLLNVSTPGNLNFGLTNSLTLNCRGTFAVAVADYNMDGKADIASINYGAPINGPVNAFVSVYLGNGVGTFTPPSPGTFTTENTQPTGIGAGGQYLAVGDFNNDGAPDLIVASATNRIAVLTNTTTPVAAAATVSATAVNAGQTDLAQRSRVTSIQVTFNRVVTFTGATAAAFQLARIGGGQVGSFAASAQTVGGVTVVTLTGFQGAETVGATANNSLADGRYQLKVLSAQVAGGLDGDGNGTAGDDYVLSGTAAAGTPKLFRFYGDGDGDGDVDGTDLSAYIPTLFNPGNYVAKFDSDGDGDVDGTDLARLIPNLFAPLP